LSITGNVAAQSFSAQEKYFSQLIAKLPRFAYANQDSLDYNSAIFTKTFTEFIEKHPSTLNYPFKSLMDGKQVFIATSPDGLLRTYCWSNWSGLTNHDFVGFYQYKSGGKVYTSPIGAAGYYSQIFLMKANGKNYYLAIAHAVFNPNSDAYDKSDFGESISIFFIKNNQLDGSEKLFKSPTKIFNRIEIHFDIFSVVNRPEGPLRLIKFDPVKKIVYIPVITDKNEVTDRFTLYQFKGRYFEQIVAQKSNPKSLTIKSRDAIKD
jgi:hypothetical protein